MATPFLRLPFELLYKVFKSLNDLDDARDLGRTCRCFSQLHTANKRSIARSIILDSNVYAYDICLAKFDVALSGLERSYRRNEDPGYSWMPQPRPKEDLFMECINAPRSSQSLSEEILNKICCHWRKTRIIRNLQLGQGGYFAEYEKFRTGLPMLPEEYYDESDNSIQKGFRKDLPNHERWPLFNSSATDSKFDEFFIERFHTALCLQGIAVLARRLAIATDAKIEDEPRIDQLAYEFWAVDGPCRVAVSGLFYVLSLYNDVDRLEVFDFIYVFLLEKMFSSKVFAELFEHYCNAWLFEDYPDQDYAARRVDHKACAIFMSSVRLHLTPSDIADLVCNLFWRKNTSFPYDKERYLGVRGMFDSGNLNNMKDWDTNFGRTQIINSLALGQPIGIHEKDRGTHCWWDQFRASSGSPFQTKFDWEELWTIGDLATEENDDDNNSDDSQMDSDGNDATRLSSDDETASTEDDETG